MAVEILERVFGSLSHAHVIRININDTYLQSIKSHLFLKCWLSLFIFSILSLPCKQSNKQFFCNSLFILKVIEKIGRPDILTQKGIVKVK